MSLNTTLGGDTCYLHQHGSPRQQSQGMGQQHRLQTPTWISGFMAVQAATWTSDTNMPSGGIEDHGGPFRRSNPGSETFPSRASIIAQRQGNPAARWQVQGQVCVCISSRLLYTIPPTLPGMTACRPQPSLSPVTTIQFHLSLASTPLGFSIFPLLHHVFVYCSGACLPQAAGAPGSTWGCPSP